MSNAFKCDRCGKLFEMKCSEKEKRNLYLVTNPYNQNSEHDLCNDCYTELSNWWLNMRK